MPVSSEGLKTQRCFYIHWSSSPSARRSAKVNVPRRNLRSIAGLVLEMCLLLKRLQKALPEPCAAESKLKTLDNLAGHQLATCSLPHGQVLRSCVRPGCSSALVLAGVGGGSVQL